MKRRTMKKRWTWPLGLALVGVALYGGHVSATPATVPGFTGTTLANATFGDIDSHVVSALSKPALAGDDQDAREVGPQRVQRLHSQHGLAHPFRPQPRDRHPRQRDGLRRR